MSTYVPVVTAQMCIRAPAEKVFEAFVDPDIATRFWFTRCSGPLAADETVTWYWDMYGASAAVRVLALEPARRILIEWDDPPTTVEWTFEPRDDGSTMVRIVNQGFKGSDKDIMAKALDSKGGFSLVLASLKAWLEHGVELNIVVDHHPDGHVDGWRPSQRD